MKQLNRNAFTMIELIFVIVVLGILSAVAIPKFGGTKDAADAVKGKADVATIRSAILNERQERVIQGDSAYITAANLDNGGLFGGVLQYPMPNKNSDGNWYTATTGNGSYIYNTGGVAVTFDYNATTGRFTCSTTNATYGEKCKTLVE